MPVYVYWGEDDFSIEKAIAMLRSRILDPNWISFNYTSISAILVSCVPLLLLVPVIFSLFLTRTSLFFFYSLSPHFFLTICFDNRVIEKLKQIMVNPIQKSKIKIII